MVASSGVMESLKVVGMNVKWCSPTRKQFGSSQKVKRKTTINASIFSPTYVSKTNENILPYKDSHKNYGICSSLPGLFHLA